MAQGRKRSFVPRPLNETAELLEISLARRSRAPHETDRAEGLGLDEADQRQIAAALLDAEAQFGQQRDAVACRDHLDDGGEARGSERIDHVDLLQAAVGECLIAQAVPLLEQKEAFMLDQFLRRAHASRELARLRQGKQEAILEQLHVLEIGVLYWQRQEQHIELALEQLFRERLGLGLAHVQLEVGIGIAQKRQQRR